MKIRMFTVVAVLSLILFIGTSSANLYANAPVLIPTAAEIEQVLTDMLPVFEDFYNYNLMTDLNRAGLTLTDFSAKLRNNLIFLQEFGMLADLGFDLQSDYWIFYFVDGIVKGLSISEFSEWGNVSLKGLILNDIYVQALGPQLLDGFFRHHTIMHLAQNLESAAYFDFLMRETSVSAVLSFGAAARAYFEQGDAGPLTGIIGAENMAAFGEMGNMMAMDFLAGLLIEEIVPNRDALIAQYAHFVIIPSPDMVVPVQLNLEERFGATFDAATAFDVTSNAAGYNLNVFFNNTGFTDFYVALQTYDFNGNWHIFTNVRVPAGENFLRQLRPDDGFGNAFRITVYGSGGGAVSGDIGLRKTVHLIQ